MMAERFCETKSLFIHQLFTTIASRYDWFNRLASFSLDARWRRWAVAESGVRQGMDILDVCTGTGDVALLCAQHTDGAGLVIGLDFNEAMLKQAGQKQQARRLLVRWLQGNAQALPFRSSSFDRVFIGFSTRNLSDLKQGLCEMVRVLKPNGQLVVLETGRPANPVVRAGYFLFLFTIARLIGGLLTGRLWPFTYLARSVRGFVSPSEFVSFLKTCGTDACHIPLSFGLASLYIAHKRVVG